MNYNDIDKIALEFAKLIFRERLQILKRSMIMVEKSALKGDWQEHTKDVLESLKPVPICKEGYEYALAFRDEGKKHYVNPFGDSALGGQNL